MTVTVRITPDSAGADAIGFAVWKSAARARRLGGTGAMVQDDDKVAPDNPSGRAVVSAWFAGLGLWSIVLFLLSLE